MPFRRILSALVCLLLFGVTVPETTVAARVALPQPLSRANALERITPETLMPLFLGIPYRPDGVVNDAGQYAAFNAPERVFSSPGLNCSGLVLTASRILLGSNIPVSEAVRDRLNDSGPQSPLGHDWDFGLDLILNIGDVGHGALLLPPRRQVLETPRTIPGAAVWDPHAASFAADLFPLLRGDHFYLTSFSRHAGPGSPARWYYHVGLLFRDHAGAVWHYSTTHASNKIIRLNLAVPQGLARFRHSFRNTKTSCKRLTIMEVPLQDRDYNASSALLKGTGVPCSPQARR